MRLARTFDLTGVTAGQAPTLRAQLSFDVEEGYDNVIVEAHVVGQRRLDHAAGGRGSDEHRRFRRNARRASCWRSIRSLLNYLTLGDDGCTPTGVTGAWNAMTASSGGWQEVNFDLSAYAGQQVEVSISYVSDSVRRRGRGRGGRHSRW